MRHLASFIALCCLAPVAMAQHVHAPVVVPVSEPKSQANAVPKEAVAANPVPTPTAAERAAAFPALHHAIHAHGTRTSSFFQAEHLEWVIPHGASMGAGYLAWQAKGWVGGDVHRLWVRTSGEHATGNTRGRVDILAGRGIRPWWDVLAGVQVEAGHGQPRTALALGVQGLAPGKFEVSGMAYLRTRGQHTVELEAAYDTLLTQRWVLHSSMGLHAAARGDKHAHLAAGLQELNAGARLRYEITREFAPYLGMERSWALGASRGLHRAAGLPQAHTHWVAGLRFWF